MTTFRGASRFSTSAFERRQPFTLEHRLRRHDGEYRWVLDSGVPLLAPDGSLTGYVGSSVDITERKLAEESLRRKESELTEAQRLAAIGSWQWDASTNEVVWSDELYRIAGLEPGSPAAAARNHPHLYPPEDWERISRCAEEAMRSGTPYELDVEMFSNGGRRWVTARGEAMRDADGRITGLRGTVQDITERKRAEEMLSNQSRRLLEAQEAERARIARELHDDIGQRLALLSIALEQLQQSARFGERTSTIPRRAVPADRGHCHRRAGAVARAALVPAATARRRPGDQRLLFGGVGPAERRRGLHASGRARNRAARHRAVPVQGAAGGAAECGAPQRRRPFFGEPPGHAEQCSA